MFWAYRGFRGCVLLAADLDVPVFALKRSLSTWRKLLTPDVFEWVKEQCRIKAREVLAPAPLADNHQRAYTTQRSIAGYRVQSGRRRW